MKNIVYTILLTLIFVSCDDRLDDLNTDKKNPSSVAPETLFAQSTRELFDNMTSISVNDNPFRFYSQMCAQTTYAEESRYNITEREISLGIFTNQYRNVLIDLDAAKSLIQTEIDEQSSFLTDGNLNNRIALIDILMGYTYLTMVDIFGNIPFSEALDSENLNPLYDDAFTIYDSIEEILSTSSGTLSANSSEGAFDVSDLVYGGDVELWAKFANTLKLRMAMRLADVDAAKSITWANEAMANGVFTSNADNFSIAYELNSPNTNPVYEDLVLSGRADYVIANTVTDKMNDLLDPRLMTYARNPIEYDWNVDEDGFAQDSVFNSNVIIENYDEDGDSTGTDYMVSPTLLASDSAALGDIRVYQGGIYGDLNPYSNSSQLGDILHTPDYPGTLLNYAEVRFLMAEMVERTGYTIVIGGTAEEHYNAGITASFDQWEVSGVGTYLTRAEVAYTTAEGDWKQIIGTQLWLALFNQGFEAWSTWRRLDFEGFTPPSGMVMSDIPVRMTYPQRERSLNSVSYEQAAQAIGGDLVSTKLFWDIN